MRRRLGFAAGLLAALVFVRALAASGLLIAFQGESDGGLARLDLSSEDKPAIGVATVLFRHPAFAAAAKLRVSGEGRHAVLSAEAAGRENLALIDPHSGHARLLALDFTPEEHRLAGGRAYVGGTDGKLAVVELSTGAIVRNWDSRRALSPPGHKPEDLLVLEDEGRLLVTHQKDGKKGREGNRVAVLRLFDLSLVGDLRLPRDHPELHLSEKEAGPSPEVVCIDRHTNTLLFTLDLYGALAFADLAAALEGRLENYLVLPTSGDGASRRVFPDRMAVGRVGGRSLAIVSNASDDGGLAVFDVAARRRVAFFGIEAGCAEPVAVNGGRTFATIVSGKRKRIAGDVIESRSTPGSDLLLLDLARAANGDPAALSRTPLGGPAAQVASVPGRPDIVAVALLRPACVLLCSAEDGRIVSRAPLPGRPVSLQPLP